MAKVSKNKLLFLLFAIYFFIFFLFFQFRKNFNSDYVSLVMIAMLFVALFLYKPSFILKYLFIVFYCIFMLFGLFICENTNTFLIELNTYSGYHGSFIVAVLYFLILFIFLILFDNLFSKKMKYYLCNDITIFKKYPSFTTKKTISKIIRYMIFVIGFLMFLMVIKRPSFKLDVDRFVYEKIYLPGFLSKLQNYYIYLTPLVVIPIFLSGKENNIKEVIKSFISLVPFFLYCFWTGNKFGIFFDIIILILSPFVIYLGKSKLFENKNENLVIEEKLEIKLSKNIIKILLFSILTLLCLLIPYYIFRGQNIKDSIFQRTAQQGQLWWKVYQVDSNNKMHLDELQDEIEPLFNASRPEDTNYNYGIYKVMKITTPQNIYNNKIASGSRYSAQGLETPFYYFKYFGLFFSAIVRAFFEAFLVNILIKYIFSFRIIESCIIARLLKFNHAIFTQGDLFLVFSYKTLFTILFLIILCTIYNLFIKRMCLNGKEKK